MGMGEHGSGRWVLHGDGGMGGSVLRRPDAEATATWGWLQSGAAVRELGGRCSSVPSEMMGLWSRCVCLSSHPSAVMLRCPWSDCLGCHCVLPTGLAGEMKGRFYFRHEMHQSSLAGAGWVKYVGIPISLPSLLPFSLVSPFLNSHASPPSWRFDLSPGRASLPPPPPPAGEPRDPGRTAVPYRGTSILPTSSSSYSQPRS